MANEMTVSENLARARKLRWGRMSEAERSEYARQLALSRWSKMSGKQRSDAARRAAATARRNKKLRGAAA